jgi:hypothetical protein
VLQRYPNHRIRLRPNVERAVEVLAATESRSVPNLLGVLITEALERRGRLTGMQRAIQETPSTAAL